MGFGGQQHRAEPAQQVLVASCEEEVERDDSAALLERLRLLPSAYPQAPMLWVPRRQKQQVGVIMTNLLSAAASCAAAPPGDVAAEVAHRLCGAAPQLLLRPPSSDGSIIKSHMDLENEKMSACSKVVRERISLARSGNWMELVDQCMKDLELGKQQRSAHGGRQAEIVTDADGNVPPSVAQAAAVRGRTGSLRSAACILLGGPPVPPGPDTDSRVQNLFQMSEFSSEARSKLQRASDAAAALPQRRRIRVTLRMVGQQAGRLKPAAGPGPSGMRNSHLMCMYACPDRPPALSQWCQIWAGGVLRPWLADFWTDALCRPFWKNELQEAIRPVLCCECLLKFAMGVCVSACGCKVQEAVGDCQYGAGRRGGAELEVAEVRAAAAIFPEDAFVSLDVKNAFGTVEWADALGAVTERLPQLAVPLTLQWSSFRTIVYTQDPDGHGWHAFEITGSLVQGNVEAQTVFCILIGVVVQKVHGDPRLPECVRKRLRSWAYVDDLVFKVKVSDLEVVFSSIRAHTADHAFQLQMGKCCFHVPALTGMPLSELDGRVHRFAALVPMSKYGLTLLGTEAAGELCLPLYTDASPQCTVATAKRAQRAVRLANALVGMIHAAPPAGALQAAWAINRSIVAHSLTYDSRVLPCSLVLPHAESVDEGVLAVVAAVLGVSTSMLSGDLIKQLQLPVRKSGLQIDLPTQLLPMSRAASLMEVGPALRATVSS